ncbi:class I adenylate-forming enzyme family protein [Hoeflea alexandrii]|uniref:class I adenylate-forming enzyme family protein n=1 Tax=Hoeflea alexandrii TaxID=288436 RepID=UPI0022AE8B9A|nr:AMP-binding protein [Hoeflea alexandrii]MCZ4291663.1 AMP-binding protein [Hoeflea alexandrii]
MTHLHDILIRSANAHPDQTAIIFEDRSLTFSALLRASVALAAKLVEEGAQEGDYIAFLDENSLEFPLVVFAVTLIGAIFVPVNFRFASDEIAYVLSDARPRFLLTSPSYAKLAKDAVTHDGAATQIVEVPRAETLLDVPHRTFTPARPDPSGPAMVMYTSGTTGFPKGALLSHSAYLANIRAIANAGNLVSEDKMLVALPLFHNGGLIAQLLPALSLGALAVILPRGFDPDRVLSIVEEHGITVTMWVPTMLAMILGANAQERHDAASLSKIWYGSSPIAPKLYARVKATFGAALYQFYGMTEVGMTAVLTPEDHDTHPQATGRALPITAMRIVDIEDQDVRPGEVGELIWRQSPTGMIGYLGKEEASRETIRDGWIYTGDMARNLDNGVFLLVDRKKDMIISGAENIYPREIELALLTHPDVAEVAVFGIPDPVYGEAVCAAVVVKEGRVLSEGEVIAYCAEHLAGYKKPKRVLFEQALPKNTAGKVLKAQLRAPFWKHEERAI